MQIYLNRVFSGNASLEKFKDKKEKLEDLIIGVLVYFNLPISNIEIEDSKITISLTGDLTKQQREFIRVMFVTMEIINDELL